MKKSSIIDRQNDATAPNNTFNSQSSAEVETFKVFSNLAFIPENHKYVFASKFPEHLMKYLKAETNMTHPAYKYALNCWINLCKNKIFLKRLKSISMLQILTKLYTINLLSFLEYSTILQLLMVITNPFLIFRLKTTTLKSSITLWRILSRLLTGTS